MTDNSNDDGKEKVEKEILTKNVDYIFKNLSKNPSQFKTLIKPTKNYDDIPPDDEIFSEKLRNPPTDGEVWFDEAHDSLAIEYPNPFLPSPKEFEIMERERKLDEYKQSYFIPKYNIDP